MCIETKDAILLQSERYAVARSLCQSYGCRRKLWRTSVRRNPDAMKRLAGIQKKIISYKLHTVKKDQSHSNVST
jgi:hypothetical protein